ncbi:MarR family transcriptional regulator [Rhodococcus sp. ABRD24]|uniref:MarR family winged helix-turn-helix transcriptional regulator n=1 Tax=Rhodococcus sp. ABRD24 TaxID=2507582 RepID=UPI001038C1A4|nr:MarR family transcriptional regulator [Rhodococcus sp. ABRD24]QBJ97382.1 MarR family transcriptional regulator [Rhodococcus sp. ABRD24]
MTEALDRHAALDRAFVLAEQLSASMADGAREFGLTTARTRALFCVAERPPMTQRELAAALRCSTRQVTALVDALEESGHLMREPHPTDRRAHIVTLTGSGRGVAERIRQLRHLTARTLLDGIPRENLDVFVTVADILIDRTAAGSPDRAMR